MNTRGKGSKFDTDRTNKPHRFIELMKMEIDKYNIRYREISKLTGFSIIKIKRIMAGRQNVSLNEFDILRGAIVLIKSEREQKAMPDQFAYLDKIYGGND